MATGLKRRYKYRSTLGVWRLNIGDAGNSADEPSRSWLSVGIGDRAKKCRFPWPLTSTDTYLPFAETPRNPTNSRKPTFALAESRHSFSGPEFRKQSPTDENRFFNLAVGSAALADIDLSKMLAPYPTFALLD